MQRSGRHGHTTQGDQSSWGAWDSRLSVLEPGESPLLATAQSLEKDAVTDLPGLGSFLPVQ